MSLRESARRLQTSLIGRSVHEQDEIIENALRDVLPRLTNENAALRVKVEALETRLYQYNHWTPEHTIEEWLADRQRIVDAKEAEADVRLQTQLAAMKQERDEAERREKQWEHDYAIDLKAAHAERDGQAMQIDALRTHLSAAITERNQLKEAAHTLPCIVCMDLMKAALRGKTGGG
jgi:hypothetical protein